MRVRVRPVAASAIPTARWCVEWQTALMPAPAFWYYAEEADARESARRLLCGRGGEAPPLPLLGQQWPDRRAL